MVDKLYIMTMIEDKIKLRITEYISRIIFNDCFAFEFIRNEEKANINKFLNKIIPNLVENRKKRRMIIHHTMSQTLEFISNIKFQERLNLYMDTIFDKIYFSDEEYQKLSEYIWIRPSKENISVFDEIIDSELYICQMDMSTYLRSLLNEYARLPQYQRELIVFANQMKLIRKSIETDRVLNFKYNNERYSMVAINYFSEFLYDQSNYIIGYDIKGNQIKSIKLYKIEDLYILEKKFKLADDIYETYHRIVENFEFSNSDTFDIVKE